MFAPLKSDKNSSTTALTGSATFTGSVKIRLKPCLIHQ